MLPCAYCSIERNITLIPVSNIPSIGELAALIHCRNSAKTVDCSVFEFIILITTIVVKSEIHTEIVRHMHYVCVMYTVCIRIQSMLYIFILYKISFFY